MTIFFSPSLYTDIDSYRTDAFHPFVLFLTASRYRRGVQSRTQNVLEYSLEWTVHSDTAGGLWGGWVTSAGFDYLLGFVYSQL